MENTKTYTEQQVINLLNFLIFDIETGQFNHKNEEVFFKLTAKEWLMNLNEKTRPLWMIKTMKLED
jgi:hypothetical protein